MFLCDYRQRISRDTITETSKRLLPDKWTKFVMATAFLHMFNNNQPVTLLENIKTNFYTKARKPGFIYAYNGSTLRIRKQATKFGTVLNDLSIPWCDRNLSKNFVSKYF